MSRSGRPGRRVLTAAALLLAPVAGAPAATRPGPAPSAPASADSVHGTVVADSFWSQALGIRKSLLVWLPPAYAADPARRFPVAYYLHGAGGRETDWATHGRLPATFDSLTAAGMPEMIVVMPDGDDGWYTTWNFLGDWPACRRNPPRANEAPERYCVPWPHYDDYIARDLVSYIDRRYRTRAGRGHRGIAGLSMGGYGAVSLALRYPDVFDAAFSHSGVVAPLVGMNPVGADTARYAGDIHELRARYSPTLWTLMQPAFGKDIAAWTSRDPLHLARLVLARPPADTPAIALDCGRDDPFVAQNRRFARDATAAGLALTYTEWPGAHSWDYWRAHLPESARWIAAHIAAP